MFQSGDKKFGYLPAGYLSPIHDQSAAQRGLIAYQMSTSYHLSFFKNFNGPKIPETDHPIGQPTAAFLKGFVFGFSKINTDKTLRTRIKYCYILLKSIMSQIIYELK